MKIFLQTLVLASFIIATGCQQKSGEHQHDSDDASESGGNQTLYDEVMAIHDEVMPKMNDLQKAKTALQTRLEMPGTAENEKQEINDQIARIDSASEGMMIWMRQFKSLRDIDSLGEDMASEYL
jgi:hypothetical protein